MPWKSDREDEFLYLKLFLALVVVVGAIAGLIEWNARRQAAAMTRELFRPATSEEARRIEAMQEDIERESAKETERLRRQLWQEVPPPRKSRNFDTRPLAEDERCISGQRFQRLENGWREVGTCS